MTSMTKKNKINVMFLILRMSMGGSERLVYNLASRLDRDLFNVHIGWLLDKNVLKDFEELDVPLHFFEKKHRIDLHAMLSVKKAILEHRIDIVIPQHFMPYIYCFYACTTLRRIKILPIFHSEWEIKKISFLWKIVGSQMLKITQGAIGVSKNVTESLRKEFKLDQSMVHEIWNGVPLDLLNIQGAKDRLIKEVGIMENEKIIGMVGNFRQIKNHLFLLKAFEELLKDDINAKLLLIGRGSKEDPENSEAEILSFIKDNKLESKVLLLGYRSDVKYLLKLMDVFCLTSFKEGQPISIIEAMAAGIPVIGTNVEGIRDIVQDGKTGLLVTLGDVSGLKSALKCLLMDDQFRTKLSNMAKQVAIDHYSLDKCVNQYQQLFTSLVHS